LVGRTEVQGNKKFSERVGPEGPGEATRQPIVPPDKKKEGDICHVWGLRHPGLEQTPNHQMEEK